jgi:hypothetical protein
LFPHAVETKTRVETSKKLTFFSCVRYLSSSPVLERRVYTHIELNEESVRTVNLFQKMGVWKSLELK